MLPTVTFQLLAALKLLGASTTMRTLFFHFWSLGYFFQAPCAYQFWMCVLLIFFFSDYQPSSLTSIKSKLDSHCGFYVTFIVLSALSLKSNWFFDPVYCSTRHLIFLYFLWIYILTVELLMNKKIFSLALHSFCKNGKLKKYVIYFFLYCIEELKMFFFFFYHI